MTEATPPTVAAWAALERGDRITARRILETATNADPADVAAWKMLGRVYYHDGAAAAAAAAFGRVVACRPIDADTYSELGAALRLDGDPAGAVTAFERGIAIDTTCVDNYIGLGHVYRETNRYAEAADCYRHALALTPDDAYLHYALGDAQYRNTDLNDARESLLRATELNPAHAIAFEYLGTVCKFLGRPEESVVHYDRAFQLAPTASRRYLSATVLPIMCDSDADALFYRERLIDRIGDMLADGCTLDPLTDVMPVYFFLAYQGLNDRDIARSIGQLCKPTKNHLQTAEVPLDNGRIRIGFVSSHLWNHSVGVLWHGLIGNLDRERFEVSVYSLSDRDDHVVRYLRANCEHYVELPPKPSAACEVLQSASLDVLYYTDIGMDSAVYALAAQRLAPVQCTSWGHPVTTGLSNMDYYRRASCSKATVATTTTPRHSFCFKP